jgi:hypothetical protein
MASSNNRNSSNDRNDDDDDIFLVGRGLAAQSLIDSSPNHHGVVLKLHIPVLYSVLPEFIQRFILSWSLLSSWIGPSWKQRHLILCGSYLYKFKDRSSSSPKGCPFEIDHTKADIIRRHNYSDVLPEIGNVPPGYDAIFTVSTLRREQYYAVADMDEALLWVRSIQEAKQESIKRNMGHANNVPYPQSWRHFDTLGKSLVKQKTRIRQKLEESNLREMEMTDFGKIGPMPRVYHG